MAKGINKVILIGNLGANPDVRHMPNGGAVTNIRLATTETWRDKQTGEQQERTEWHRVVFFNRLAEIAGEYLKTGAKIYIEGSLRTRKWRDNSNVERYTTEIVANDMQMLSGRNDSSGEHASSPSSQSSSNRFGQSGFSDTNSGHASNHSQQSASSEKNATPNPVTEGGMDDDDIPF